MSVINDDRVGSTGDYTPVVINAQDYYAFGSVMPGREYALNNSPYRYGFNGKENDNEVKGAGNQQDYGMRIYDPRIGKFLSVDPITKQYPELTPYQFASNRPIDGIDRDGLEYIESGAHANRIIREETARLAKINPKLARDYVEKGNRIGAMATGGMLFAGVAVSTTPVLLLAGARSVIINPQAAMGAMGLTWGALVDEDMPGNYVDDVTRGLRSWAKIEQTAERAVLNAPLTARHMARNVKQGSIAKELNTVADNTVNLLEDALDINKGLAEKSGDLFKLSNGRIYQQLKGHLYPVSGPGLTTLSGGAFQALVVLNKFGGKTKEATQILFNMKNVGEGELKAALDVYNKIKK
jgi:RHS repeat-associated protein